MYGRNVNVVFWQTLFERNCDVLIKIYGLLLVYYLANARLLLTVLQLLV